MIESILDNDFYKFTQMNAILKKYPGVPVKYVFSNRSSQKFTNEFAGELRREIDQMATLRLNSLQSGWLSKTAPFLTSDFLAYLREYRFNPEQVQFHVEDGELKLGIEGPWEETILWEVPLLALISELYFKHCDQNWSPDGQSVRAREKAEFLELNGIKFSEFGTRRRRDFRTQYLVTKELAKAKTFIGTSNVHIAYLLGLKPIGTMAHEWIMGVSALESLRYANRYALKAWNDVYQGNLGIALTDTFGTDAFFGDFDPQLARMFDGVRHDSGDPFDFARKAIAHYEKLKINPRHKSIIFSDSLTVQSAHCLQQAFGDQINVSFGIGTHFTNHFDNSPALNIVIKMYECNGILVVKLSDVPTKSIGDWDALRVARWTFEKVPLDRWPFKKAQSAARPLAI